MASRSPARRAGRGGSVAATRAYAIASDPSPESLVVEIQEESLADEVAYASALDLTEARLFGPRPAATRRPGAVTAHIEDDVKRRTLLGLLGTTAAVPLAEH